MKFCLSPGCECAPGRGENTSVRSCRGFRASRRSRLRSGCSPPPGLRWLAWDLARADRSADLVFYLSFSSSPLALAFPLLDQVQFSVGQLAHSGVLPSELFSSPLRAANRSAPGGSEQNGLGFRALS